VSVPANFKLALACGAGGTFVDVSEYLEATQEFTYNWGRQSSFEDFPPGEFTFVLNNADGRFTPDNTASALDVSVTEGMRACWQVDTRLVSGSVQAVAPLFPNGESAWATVQITCDDFFGDLSRNELISLFGSIILAADPYLFYRLDDADDAFQAREYYGGLPLNRVVSPETTGGTVTFGVDPIPVIGDTQMQVSCSLQGDIRMLSNGVPSTISYPAGEFGVVSAWLTLNTEVTATTRVSVSVGRPCDGVGFGIYNGLWGFSSDQFGGIYSGSGVDGAGPFFLEWVETVSGSTATVTLYVNGTVVVTNSYALAGAPTNLDKQITQFGVVVSNTAAVIDTATFSHLSHTPDRLSFGDTFATTTGNRITQLGLTTPAVALDTLPTDLSPWQVGVSNTVGQSALEALNDAIRGVQGSLYQKTTGTLTSPTQLIGVRSRVRSETVDYTFDVEDDLSGSPNIVRDITDLVSTVTVSGSDGELTVTDSDLLARAGSKNVSETVLFSQNSALYEFATDRLLRGSLVSLRISTFTVDAVTTPTDRLPDLLALLPGDRVQLTGLPSTQLGFATWDGWFLGASETHGVGTHEFQLFFEPCSPSTATFDEGFLFMGGEDLTLTANINSAVTSVSVDTVGSLFSATEVPYTVAVGDEQMTVTAVTGTAPQVLTVVRGVNSTTAASHLLGDVIDVVPSSLFAY